MFGLLVVKPVLAFPGVFVGGFLTGVREPVGAFPTRNFTEHRAPRLQMVMQGRAADAAGGFDLTVGEVVGVEKAEGFCDPLLEVFAVALEGLGAADVDLPEVEGRLFLDDPMGKRHACAAGTRDADRVVAGGDPVAAKLGGLAEVIAVVGGERLGAVEEGVDAGGLEQRQAVHGVFEDGLEVVPILGQGVEHEVVADAVHAPGLGFRFKGADHHLAGVGFVIGALIRHAQDGQMAQTGHGFGDEVEVFAGVQGQGDAGLARKLPAPHAAAVHHDIRGDMARLAVLGEVVDAGDLATRLGDTGDLGVFKDLRALHPGTLGQGHGNVGRVALAVQRQVDRADDAVDVEVGIHRLGFARRDFRDIDVEDAGDGGLAQQFLVPRFGQGDRDGADLTHPRLDPGFGGELDVKISGVFGQTGHVGRTPKLADQARGVPGGARGQLLALQQHDIGPTHLGEVIGDRAARDATADNDRAGFGGDAHWGDSVGTRTSLPGYFPATRSDWARAMSRIG